MKSVKVIIATFFIALGLTGCYTQLQYSQGVSRVADEKSTEGYSWNGSSEESAEYYQGEDERQVPFYYKDYDKANWWSSCHCNPYVGSYGTSYHFNNPWYDHYSRFHYGYAGFHDPFYYSSRWKWRYFGLGFHHSFFAFDLYWGSPFYAHGGFLYGPYWGGYYHRPYWYGHRRYYGGYYDHDDSNSAIRSRTYRPRSIGTNRVANTNNRGDNRTRSRSVTRQSSSTQERGIRSTGSSRTRGAVQQGSSRVQQPRTRGTSRVDSQSRSGSDSNARSRGTVQERSRSQSTSSSSVRTRGTQRSDRNTSRMSSTGLSSDAGIWVRSPRSVNRTKADESVIKSRISRQRVDQPNVNTSNDDRSSFFGRVGKIFNSSTPDNSIRIYRSRNNNSSVKSNNIFRQQTRTRSTTISQPRSTNRSSVTKSRSTSSSRSRATSSSSRSSSSRSRGN